jgi:hypothetical protein
MAESSSQQSPQLNNVAAILEYKVATGKGSWKLGTLGMEVCFPPVHADHRKSEYRAKLAEEASFARQIATASIPFLNYAPPNIRTARKPNVACGAREI